MLQQTDKRRIKKMQRELQTMKLQLDLMTVENGKGKPFGNCNKFIDNLIMKIEQGAGKINFAT